MHLWILVFSLTAVTAKVSQTGSPEASPQLIRIGSTYYTPLYRVRDLQGAESAALGVSSPFNPRPGQGYYQPPKRGYSYPVPTTTPPLYTQPERGYSYPAPTRPPPLSEEGPSENEEEYVTEKPTGVAPDREAILPTTQGPIGLEFEEDNESQAIAPPELPRPVTDRPSFEVVRDCDDNGSSNSWPCGYRDSIPGIEGVDYPIYSSLPKTGFRCNDYPHSGYFADVEARCQVFHVCLRRQHSYPKKWSFLCPNGTIFNQRDFVCSWWHESVPCSESVSFYDLNTQLDWDQVTDNTMIRMNTLRLRPTLPPFAVRSKPTGTRTSNGNPEQLGATLLQVQRSKTITSGEARTRSQSLQKIETAKSDSEAYEDKSIPAEGFIVNRLPRPQQTEAPAAGPTPAPVTQPSEEDEEFTDEFDFGPATESQPQPQPQADSQNPQPQPPQPQPQPEQPQPQPQQPQPQHEQQQEQTEQQIEAQAQEQQQAPKVYGPPNYVPPEPTSPPATLSFDEELIDSVGSNPDRREVSYEAATSGNLIPKPNFKPANPTQNFRAKDATNINKILESSNILDSLPDGIEFSGFSGLASSDSVQEYRVNENGDLEPVQPKVLDLVKPKQKSHASKKELVGSQEEQKVKEPVQNNEYDRVALFVPGKGKDQGRSKAEEAPNELPRESLYKFKDNVVQKARPVNPLKYQNMQSVRQKQNAQEQGIAQQHQNIQQFAQQPDQNVDVPQQQQIAPPQQPQEQQAIYPQQAQYIQTFRPQLVSPFQSQFVPQFLPPFSPFQQGGIPRPGQQLIMQPKLLMPQYVQVQPQPVPQQQQQPPVQQQQQQPTPQQQQPVHQVVQQQQQPVHQQQQSAQQQQQQQPENQQQQPVNQQQQPANQQQQAAEQQLPDLQQQLVPPAPQPFPQTFPQQPPLFRLAAPQRPAFYPAMIQPQPQRFLLPTYMLPGQGVPNFFQGPTPPTSPQQGPPPTPAAGYGDQMAEQSDSNVVSVPPPANKPEFLPALGIYSKTIVSQERPSSNSNRQQQPGQQSSESVNFLSIIKPARDMITKMFSTAPSINFPSYQQCLASQGCLSLHTTKGLSHPNQVQASSVAYTHPQQPTHPVLIATPRPIYATTARPVLTAYAAPAQKLPIQPSTLPTPNYQNYQTSQLQQNLYKHQSQQNHQGVGQFQPNFHAQPSPQNNQRIVYQLPQQPMLAKQLYQSVNQFQQNIPKQQYPQTISKQQYHQTQPKQQYQQTIPKQQYQQAIPKQQYQQTLPKQQYQQTIPKQQYQQTIPKQQYQQAIPQQQYQHQSSFQSGNQPQHNPKNQEQVQPNVYVLPGGHHFKSTPNSAQTEAPFKPIFSKQQYQRGPTIPEATHYGKVEAEPQYNAIRSPATYVTYDRSRASSSPALSPTTFYKTAQNLVSIVGNSGSGAGSQQGTHYDRTKEPARQSAGTRTHYDGTRSSYGATLLRPAPAPTPTLLHPVTTHKGNVPVHNAGTRSQQEGSVAYGK